MSDNEQQYWHAKRLMNVAAKATTHASKRIRQSLPALVALRRAQRLGDAARAEWQKVLPC